MPRSLFAVATLAVVLAAACSRASPPPPAPTPTTPASPAQAAAPAPRVYIATPGGEVGVEVEVVRTSAAIEKGLMYREHLPPDAGMLFLMDEEREWSFYMRNTLIPLDMIFIKADRTIAGIVENAEPRTETLRRVATPSLYVLEVNGGWVAAHGVKPGAVVRFDRVP